MKVVKDCHHVIMINEARIKPMSKMNEHSNANGIDYH